MSNFGSTDYYPLVSYVVLLMSRKVLQLTFDTYFICLDDLPVFSR